MVLAFRRIQEKKPQEIKYGRYQELLWQYGSRDRPTQTDWSIELIKGVANRLHPHNILTVKEIER